jgi:hypothetical protein
MSEITEKVDLTVNVFERIGVSGAYGRDGLFIKENVEVPVNLPDEYGIATKYFNFNIQFRGWNQDKQRKEFNLKGITAWKYNKTPNAYEEKVKFLEEDGFVEVK